MLRTMTENGKVYAIIPIEEYERIIGNIDEDEADVMAFDKAKALNEESFPLRLFKEIDAGENPVRVFRNYRGIPARTLAEAAGISEAYLSQIESGVRKGTGKTLKSIAKALKISVDELVL